jgi:anthranilate phosphoribosyltransferase
LHETISVEYKLAGKADTSSNSRAMNDQRRGPDKPVRRVIAANTAMLLVRDEMATAHEKQIP